MAIEKMEMVSIVGEYKQLNKAIYACVSTGCYQPESTSDIMSNVKGFTSIIDENPYTEQLKRITDIFRMCDITPEIVESSDLLSDVDINNLLNKIDPDIHDIYGQRTRLSEKIQENKRLIEQLEHFIDADINLNELFECKFIKVRFGRLPIESYHKLNQYSNAKNLFFPCSSDETYLWGMYVAPINSAKDADRIFASLFFERLYLPDNAGTPQDAYSEYTAESKDMNNKLKELNDHIDSYFDSNLDECLQLYSQIKCNYESFEVRRFAARYNDIFMLIGWIPESKKESFNNAFSDLKGIQIEYDKPENIKKFVPPTLMKNKKLFRPFQFYTEIYGVPRYTEVDPTMFVAITYTLLYGIMFADLGQGIILSLVGYFMFKKMNMPLGKILIPCGIFSSIFGLMFGSVFGYEELLNPMFHALGFAEKPIEIMKSATSLLLLSVAIGVFLVICAMLINIYSCFKRKEKGVAIFGQNGIAGVVLYSSFITLILTLVTDISINTTVLILLGIVLPIILIFLKEPLSDLVNGHKVHIESIGEYILESFFEVFEVILSYLSNTLSFLRVGAFVLIHAGMMTTFTSLSEIAGGGMPSIIVMIFGNIFVIVLEGLLVGIQVLRLEYYEMFSRFYNGDGHVFEPIKLKIKANSKKTKQYS
ncbi:MAG: V-type ATPase 116kDa subunit family protein [Oscillospiraceae bacterium]|nr:V-type ATPase 116kDa subunit family protein [Oscillospiraceae bacterium]